jgi:hypothetical protein
MTNAATHYAVSVRACKRTADGETWIDSPTFYLSADVQGITDEDHAKRIVLDWFARLGFMFTDISVAVAETTVHGPDEQANSLKSRVLRGHGRSVVFKGPVAGLPDDYLLVIDDTGFECGIAPDGRVSS